MATNIFVGYSAADFGFSEALMTALAATGAHIWHEEQPSDETSQLLGECQVYLLILSKGSLLAPALRNQALKYATIHNFHHENRLLVIQLEPLAKRDLWLFIRHNPQIVRDHETDEVFIPRIVQQIAALNSIASANGEAVVVATAPRITSLNGPPTSKRGGKNQWRPIFAITSLVLAFVAVIAIAGWQLWLVPHASLPGTATTAASSSGSTASGTAGQAPTSTPSSRAITTTQSEATATPHATPLATATPHAHSAPASPTVIVPLTPTVDFSRGFVNTNNLQLNGGASLSGTALRLTDNTNSEARSVFYTTPMSITAFTCHFTFQDTNSMNSADGLTFTIQNNNPGALGPAGLDLGYTGIGKSVAIKFDLYSTYQNAPGEQVSTTGIYLNGTQPDQPEIPLPSGLNFHSGDVFDVVITYSAGTLATTITDSNTNGNANFSQNYPVDIPDTVGGNTAYVGFTGATGSLASTQDILSWSYSAH